MNDFATLSEALERGFGSGKVSAVSQGSAVLLFVQDAPAELRRLADLLEHLGVTELRACLRYPRPVPARLSLPVSDEGGASQKSSDLKRPDKRSE